MFSHEIIICSYLICAKILTNHYIDYLQGEALVMGYDKMGYAFNLCLLLSLLFYMNPAITAML